MSAKPEDLLRRTPIYRHHVAAGAVFGAVNGMACPLRFGGQERDLPGPVMLADLSALPRWGLKGRDALSWLRERGLLIGERDNMAYDQEDGGLVARLGPGEALLLSGLDGRGAIDLQPERGDQVRAYGVPRASANIWFYLCGAQSSAVLAKLCAIDLRPKKFARGALAQTSVAGLTGIIIRHDAGKTPGYHLLADFASAAYLWEVLLDAMVEFGGGVAGLDEILKLEEMSQ